MIDKLRSKISLIVLCAISIPFIIIILFYGISYYNNTIRANSIFVDRFGPDKKDKFNITDLDGVYSLSIDNGVIKNKSLNVTSEVEESALKVISKSSDSGIVGHYIYTVRVHKDKKNDIDVTLIESSVEINKLNLVIISLFMVLGIGIVLIYFLSRKIATLIVKPVCDTFNKQKDFISDASHELKTPLAVISANADVLEGEIGKNKWLSYIQNEIDNMNKLISELLLLSKIENVDMLRESEEFDMSSHVELVVSSFESMAFEKKVKIESSIQKDIITSTFNRDDITHILSTLIDNAIKHTEKKVIVELEKNKDRIIINVKNKGDEIPLSERDKIFDRFYRIDKSRNRNEKRYGLGLSIAKAIVLKNNGIILVDYKDGYTIFRVELPF